ncbi:MAG: efflux RND transporter periplasmic adaptor subunit [Pseudomonadota bacterium]
MEGQIQSAEAEDKLAGIEVARQRTLFEKDTVAEAVVQRAEAEQGKIAGQIVELQGSLRAAELDLSYTTVTAPFDGRVGLTDIDIGAFVEHGSGALVSLSSIDPIYVTFPVAETVLIDFRAKRDADPAGPPVSARITLANGSVYPRAGTIEVVDTTVQAGTDTIRVRASFPNPSGTLLDGQLVELTVTDRAAETSLTIPVQSLQRDQAGYFTMVVGSDGKVEKRILTLDRIADLRAIIADGLSEGEQVIFEGVQRVRAGIEVTAEPAGNVPEKTQ